MSTWDPTDLGSFTSDKVLARDLSIRLYNGQITPWMGIIKKFNKMLYSKNSCWESSVDLNLVHTRDVTIKRLDV